MHTTDRRTFVRGLGATALAVCCGRAGAQAPAEDAGAPFPGPFGVCGSVDQSAALKEAGAAYIEAGVRSLLVPDQPAEAFAQRLVRLKSAVLSVPACNSFLPGELKCVGPEANPEAVLAYAGTAFERAREAGVAIIVFGSGGSRRIPTGTTPEQAQAQFAELLRRLGPLAQAQGVLIAIEPLRRQECNFINTVREGAGMVEAVGHPAVRLLADLYHMLQNGETAADLRAVGSLLVHTHIAEKAGRTAPGVAGDDFRPFFAALRASGYAGRMSIEGKWNLEQLPKAFATMREQAAG